MSKLIPNTLFMRLFLLLAITLSISHLLGIELVSSVREYTSPGMGPPPLPGSSLPGASVSEPAGPVLHAPPGSAGEGQFSAGRRPPHKPPVIFLVMDLLSRLAGLLLVSWVGARWLSAPIKRMAQAAHAFGKHLDAPALEETGTIEVRQAAQALNEMREKLRRQINERSVFLAAISHDLRTPLTRMQLRADAITPDSLQQKFRADIAEMSSMLSSALEYLRGHMDLEEYALTDIGSLVQAMAEDLQEQGHPVTVSGQARPLRMKPLAIKRCLSNLVQNAIKYGGSAAISLTETPTTLVIEVADEGPGIAEQRMEDVFLPFYRLEGSRNRNTGGVGLGLTIARDIALGHGGDLTLRNAKPTGLIATLVLPRDAH